MTGWGSGSACRTGIVNLAMRVTAGRIGDRDLGEMFISINGERVYLWRAVDQDGVVLNILVRSRRNT
ncbi:DDE-type integrase/transposase/recombinase [Rhodococcus sp. JVH1]|uniref:DDE-type integrase/transposase/recombinase n=1 Tax=Rhodococcus sp. JVH1 TaxID=745408 RepID=UPI00352545B2